MTPLDKVIIPIALISIGWLLHEMSDMKQPVFDQSEQPAACDAAFVNLTAEQIMAIETCNTDTECRDLAVANGIPKECAE